MSGGLDRIREKLAAYLNEQGVAAVTAWPAQERLLREGPVTAVTLRACQAGPAGFQSYLGEALIWNGYNLNKKRKSFLYNRMVK